MSTAANQTLSSVASTLQVTTETVEDSGIYSCFAKNHYGSDETSMRLLVQGESDLAIVAERVSAIASAVFQR